MKHNLADVTHAIAVAVDLLRVKRERAIVLVGRDTVTIEIKDQCAGIADAITCLPEGIKGNKDAVAETIANRINDLPGPDASIVPAGMQRLSTRDHANRLAKMTPDERKVEIDRLGIDETMKLVKALESQKPRPSMIPR